MSHPLKDLPELVAVVEARLRENRAEGKRLLVALAGPPGVGKSTLAEQLVQALNGGQADTGKPEAAVLAMDGYHLDNVLLDAAGLRARKGSPDTFDVAGFASVLSRLRASRQAVAIPVFDRAADMSRAAAAWISPDTDILVVEGNYLLLDAPGWRELGSCFDLTVRLGADMRTLRRRLIDRWLDHGHSESEALARAESNDLPNARQILEHSLPADYVFPSG